jgi:DNA-binding NtrC family response regulator
MLLHQHERKREVTMLITNILIVDDEAEVRNVLSSILEDEGYLVETVENGKQALKACEKFPYDVALIDIDLPDIKGVELLPKLKQLQPKMIKIIITGHPSVEYAVKALNEHSDGFILKPFNVPELLEMIKKLLQEKKNEYFKMFTEVENARKNGPILRYQHPDQW